MKETKPDILARLEALEHAVNERREMPEPDPAITSFRKWSAFRPGQMFRIANTLRKVGELRNRRWGDGIANLTLLQHELNDCAIGANLLQALAQDIERIKTETPPKPSPAVTREQLKSLLSISELLRRLSGHDYDRLRADLDRLMASAKKVAELEKVEP